MLVEYTCIFQFKSQREKFLILMHFCHEDANTTYHVEMPHDAAFHLGLQCLPKYLLAGIQNKKQATIRSRRKGQRTNHLANPILDDKFIGKMSIKCESQCTDDMHDRCTIEYQTCPMDTVIVGLHSEPPIDIRYVFRGSGLFACASPMPFIYCLCT